MSFLQPLLCILLESKVKTRRNKILLMEVSSVTYFPQTYPIEFIELNSFTIQKESNL